MDKNLIGRRFHRSAATYHQSAVVQSDMGDELLNLLLAASGGTTVFPRVLEIGCGCGVFTGKMLSRIETGKLFWNDLYLPESLPGGCECEALPGDIEAIALPERLNLVISNAALQWVENFSALTARIESSLTEGGWFAFSTFGPENLCELRRLGIKSLYYPSVDQLCGELSAHFEICGVRSYLHELEFADAATVLRHLKCTGATAVAGRASLTRKQLSELCEAYDKTFRNPSGTGVAITYHPVIIVCRKRP